MKNPWKFRFLQEFSTCWTFAVPTDHVIYNTRSASWDKQIKLIRRGFETICLFWLVWKQMKKCYCLSVYSLKFYWEINYISLYLSIRLSSAVFVVGGGEGYMNMHLIHKPRLRCRRSVCMVRREKKKDKYIFPLFVLPRNPADRR